MILTVQIQKIQKLKKLFQCEVFDGNKSYTVVTAAKNTYLNLVTLLALPGSSIQGKTIGIQDFFNVSSYGMLCSPKDLQIHPESGLVDLEPSTPLGKKLEEINQIISSTPWYKYTLIEQFFLDKTINKVQGKLLSETYFFQGNYYYRSVFH